MNLRIVEADTVWVRIKHRFDARMMEWFYAVHTLLWGAVLALPGNIFVTPAWSEFEQLFGDDFVLGWIMVTLGMLRLGGLIVNGARKDVTPFIRQISAGLGCLVWVGISYCYASSGVFSTWLAIYPVMAVGELVNLKRAANDQEKARHDGSTG